METRVALNTVKIKIDSFRVGSEEQRTASLQALCQTVLEKATRYDQAETSIMGRVETFANISESLQNLACRIGETQSLFEWISTFFGYEPENVLWKTINQLEKYKSKHDPCILIALIDKIGKLALRLLHYFAISYVESESMSKIKQAAFRTVRTLSFSEMESIDKRIDGSLFYLCFKALREDLQEYQVTARDSQKIAHLVRQLEFGEHISYESDIAAGAVASCCPEELDTVIADLSYEIEKIIEDLPISGSVLIPAGYATDKGGHAIVLEMERVSQDRFQLIVRNTGEGAGHNIGLWGTIKMLWNWASKPVVFEGLTREAAADQTFIKKILSFMIDKTKGQEGINGLLSTLENHCITQHKGTRKMLDTSHDLQSWGTCGYDSILSYLKDKLSPDEYKSFQAFLLRKGRAALDELLPTARQEGLLDNYTLTLIDEKSRKAFAAL